MLTAVINAETRTPQGKVVSTFYRHTTVATLPEAYEWVNRITRAFTRHTYAYVTISDNPTFTTVAHYRWTYTGHRQWCPSRRLRVR